MSKKDNFISDADKLRYVNQYLKGGIGMRDLSMQAGVSVSCICKWVKCYTTNGTFSRYNSIIKTEPNNSMKKTEPKTHSPKPDARDAEIARLKADLAKARLQVLALDTMIDVAEENLKIKIRKKAGAKQ